MLDNRVKLFCDGSVNPQEKIGCGAYFIFEEGRPVDVVEETIHLKIFKNTSSTKLELETLLWALEDPSIKDKEIVVYTDCQNILGLKERRQKLEGNDYYSKTGKLNKNSELYKQFYKLTDTQRCQFEKVKGHKKTSLKNDIDKLFNLVDKASRKALREYLKEKREE